MITRIVKIFCLLWLLSIANANSPAKNNEPIQSNTAKQALVQENAIAQEKAIVQAKAEAPKKATVPKQAEAPKKTTVQEKAEVCAACHNKNGISTNPLWPNIAGQQKKYLIKQITEIRDDTRKVPEMHVMVKDFTDADIIELAEYFSTQKAAAGASTTADLKIAESMFFSGSMDKRKIPACGSCHNYTGKGIALTNFPSLAGQHPQYLKKQLTEFRSGVRNNDDSAVMRSIAKYLTDEEIDALADYITGIQPLTSKQ